MGGAGPAQVSIGPKEPGEGKTRNVNPPLPAPLPQSPALQPHGGLGPRRPCGRSRPHVPARCVSPPGARTPFSSLAPSAAAVAPSGSAARSSLPASLPHPHTLASLRPPPCVRTPPPFISLSFPFLAPVFFRGLGSPRPRGLETFLLSSGDRVGAPHPRSRGSIQASTVTRPARTKGRPRGKCAARCTCLGRGCAGLRALNGDRALPAANYPGRPA